MFLVQQIKDGKIVNDYDKTLRSPKAKCDFLEQSLGDKIDIEWIDKKNQPYQMKMKFNSNDIKFNIYLSSVTYLGVKHPTYKKRMQLSNAADRTFLKVPNSKSNITLMLGLYLYDESNPIFVAWDSSSNMNAGKSKSSHVYINDIMLAIQNGVSQRKDKYNNSVYCFKPSYLFDFINYNYLYLEHDITFIDYLKEFDSEIDEYMFLDGIVDCLKEDLIERNSVWDGKDCISEMKNNNYRNWAQAEWQGFFFEYLVQKEIKNINSQLEQILDIPGPKYGKTVFDSFYNIPWDFKVHVEGSNEVLTNDMDAINKALDDYGKIGFIIVSGTAEKEISTELRDWKIALRGKVSKYQQKNIDNEVSHRALKTKFKPTSVKVVVLDKNSLPRHGRLGSLKNSNGNPRKEKLKLYLNRLTEEEIILFELLTD